MGSTFALIGVGFSLTWGVMKVINIADAAFGSFAAYLAYCGGWAFSGSIPNSTLKGIPNAAS